VFLSKKKEERTMAVTIADGNKVNKVVGGEKSKTITLKSSDGDQFEMTREAAVMSQSRRPSNT
jgi:hypothetical protein